MLKVSFGMLEALGKELLKKREGRRGTENQGGCIGLERDRLRFRRCNTLRRQRVGQLEGPVEEAREGTWIGHAFHAPLEARCLEG